MLARGEMLKLMPKKRLAESLGFAMVVLPLTGAFVFWRSLPTLPTVMKDEYVYMSQSLREAEVANQFGNFLHSLLYSSALIAEGDFYTNVKLLNAVFFISFALFVTMTAREFINKKLALLLGVATTLGATGLYLSVFTPEVMFYAFASASIYFLTLGLSLGARGQILFTAYAVIFLALAGLTKPHALILAIGFIGFLILLLVLRRTDSKLGLILISEVIVGYVVLKLGLGFLIAGAEGLTILGANYQEALDGFIRRVSEYSQGALSASGVVPGSTSGASLASISSFVLLQFAILAAALLFMTFGLPLLLIRHPDQLNDFQILIISVTLVYLLAVAAFTGLVTVAGDDHSNRILARYFEFLVPFVILAVWVQASRITNISKRRLAWSIATMLLLGFVWLTVIADKGFRLADSGILLGAFREGLLPWLVVVIGVGCFIFMRLPNIETITWTAILVFGGSAMIGLSSWQRQLDVNSTAVASDFAGHDLRENFSEVEGDEILVVGTNRQLAFVTKFWSMKSGVDDLIVAPGSSGSITNDVFEDYTIVIELEEIEITDGLVLSSGDGYRILANPGR